MSEHNPAPDPFDALRTAGRYAAVPSVEAIRHRGHQRAVRTRVGYALASVAVAGAGTSVAVADSPNAAGGTVAAAAASLSTSAVSPSRATVPAPAEQSHPGPAPVTDHLAQVKLAHQAKASAMEAATRRHVEAAGYSVVADTHKNWEEVGSPAGYYEVFITFSDGRKTGRVAVTVQSPFDRVVGPSATMDGADLSPSVCATTLRKCRLVPLPDGRVAALNSDQKRLPDTTGRHLFLYTRDGQEGVVVQNLGPGPDTSPLMVSDDLLVAIAADPELSLAGVPALTPAELAALPPARTGPTATGATAPSQ